MQGVTAAVQALIAQMNGPFIIAVFVVLAILGTIFSYLETHHEAWRYLTKTVIIGAMCMAAATLVGTVLSAAG